MTKLLLALCMLFAFSGGSVAADDGGIPPDSELIQKHRGPPGAPGAPGAPGPRGHRGHKGDEGHHGKEGATGPQGATGETGAAGGTGATGAAGATGATGLPFSQYVMLSSDGSQDPTTPGGQTEVVFDNEGPGPTSGFTLTGSPITTVTVVNAGVYEISFGVCVTSGAPVSFAISVNGGSSTPSSSLEIDSTDTLQARVVLLQLNAGDSLQLILETSPATCTIGTTAGGDVSAYLSITQIG